MEENTFTYRYSAARNKEVEAIRKKYLPKEESKFEQLKRLDQKVTAPAKIFSYVLGSIAAIIMGAGMSLCMTDIGVTVGMTEAMIPGIVIGIAGMALALLNLPLHKAILNSRKKKYAAEIVNLSEKKELG